MASDKTHSLDTVSASIETVSKRAFYPCSKCGAETKMHHPVLDDDTGDVVTKRRICSHRNCRLVMDID